MWPGYGQSLTEVGPLRRVVPAWSGIATWRVEEERDVEDRIEWKIVVGAPTVLSRAEWWSVRQRVMDVLRLKDLRGPEGVELCEAGREAETVELWNEEGERLCNAHRMGAAGEVRRALGI
jgi:hypothetical protein